MSQTNALLTLKQDLTPSQISIQFFPALITTVATTTSSARLSVAPEREGVVPLPGRPARSVVVAIALAQATVLMTPRIRSTLDIE